MKVVGHWQNLHKQWPPPDRRHIIEYPSAELFGVLQDLCFLDFLGRDAEPLVYFIMSMASCQILNITGFKLLLGLEQGNVVKKKLVLGLTCCVVCPNKQTGRKSVCSA